MKKLLAILLVMALVLVNVAALAESTASNILKDNQKTELYNNTANKEDPNNNKDVGTATAPFTVKLTKKYTEEGINPVVPDHSVVFTVATAGIEENEAAAYPSPDLTIGTVTEGVADGVVDIVDGEGEMKINLPEYTAVGVYNYILTETNKDKNGKTIAGVQYPTETYKLKVTVVQGEGLALGGIDAKGLVVAGVALRKGEATDKLAEIENLYSAGSLEISKKVTGNMGDLTKEFDITVTFTPESGTTVFSDIGCTGTGKVNGAAPAAISAGEGWTSKEIKVTLANGQSVKFDNIPSGVTYKVEEDDYTTEAGGEYDTAKYDGKETGIIAKTNIEEISTEIINNKDIDIDTGVSMETVPYIMILALALIGAAVLFIRKREEY